MNERLACGKFGEEEAKKYLQKRGYIVLQTNYRCREGEIDLIAREGEWLVFVEVKTRRSYAYGMPCEAVDERKRSKIIAAAQKYLLDNTIESALRFDVIEVICASEGDGYRLKSLNHIKFAFEEE